MKQHINRAIFLTVVLFFVAGVGMLFADENTVNLESRPVALSAEKGPDGNLLYGTWYLDYSKFATKGFPILTDVKAWPVAVYGNNPVNKDIKSLGVAMLFDRKEYNWVDIIPGTKEQPIEVPLTGRVKMLDMWVWSGNFDYYLEAFVRDFKGIVHTIRMGDLTFTGWKNLRINIPDNIPQSKKYLPKREALSLVKFRIWTRPTEVVAIPSSNTAPALDPKDPDFEKKNNDRNLAIAVKFYFNNVKVLTDTFETLFDGDNLSSAEASKEAWSTAGGKK